MSVVGPVAEVAGNATSDRIFDASTANSDEVVEDGLLEVVILVGVAHENDQAVYPSGLLPSAPPISEKAGRTVVAEVVYNVVLGFKSWRHAAQLEVGQTQFELVVLGDEPEEWNKV